MAWFRVIATRALCTTATTDHCKHTHTTTKKDCWLQICVQIYKCPCTYGNIPRLLALQLTTRPHDADYSTINTINFGSFDLSSEISWTDLGWHRTNAKCLSCMHADRGRMSTGYNSVHSWNSISCSSRQLANGARDRILILPKRRDVYRVCPPVP